MHDEKTPMAAKFSLGKLAATMGASDVLENHAVSPQELIHRHLIGDWGCVCSEDAKANEVALMLGARLLSSYHVGDATVWVITEADRSLTTILLPSEY